MTETAQHYESAHDTTILDICRKAYRTSLAANLLYNHVNQAGLVVSLRRHMT